MSKSTENIVKKSTPYIYTPLDYSKKILNELIECEIDLPDEFKKLLNEIIRDYPDKNPTEMDEKVLLQYIINRLEHIGSDNVEKLTRKAETLLQKNYMAHQPDVKSSELSRNN